MNDTKDIRFRLPFPGLKMRPIRHNLQQETYERARRSVDWLRENYSHIWRHPDLNVDQKAGFLAACCDSRRCCLAQLALPERITYIQHALIQEGL